MSDSDRPVLVVDGMSVFRTVAGAAAHLDNGLIYAFLTQLTATMKKMRAKHIFVCWEGGYGGREKLLPGYKSDRPRTPGRIQEERAILKRLLVHLGVDQVYAPGYEGDDVVAFLANTLSDKVVIYSNDKDVLQLVNERVSVYQKVRGLGMKKVRELITLENFAEKIGHPSPDVWLLCQLACGDAVDQIPPIGGIGPGIIHAYHLGMDVPPAKRAKLDEFYNGSPQYHLNKSLMDLRDVTTLECELTPGKPDMAETLNLLTELGFNSIVGRFPEWFQSYEEACGA